MLCVRPFRTPSGEFGCGQCMACRTNRRRLLTGRIVLEAHLHPANCFATLTYEDAPPELVPSDMTKFVRSLSYRLDRPVRYYGCGEYGDLRGRPHYHLALFGVSFLEDQVIRQAWEYGGVHVGDLTHESAQYIAGYVLKKMTSKDDERLEGRHPEFARMSNRPGIGRDAMPFIAQQLMQDGASRALARDGDVPNEIMIGKKRYPLGRYLKRELRKELGWSGETPQIPLQRRKEEFLSMTPEEREKRERNRVVAYDTALARAKIHSSKRKI